MSIRFNYHTHTTYCDGIDTPEEMIRYAIEKGFDTIGFSGHSHTPHDESYAMSIETARVYRDELRALREKYADQINVLIGVEFDYFSDEVRDDWEYCVGSVHYVQADSGEFLAIDESADITLGGVEKYFNGDIYSLCERYYETVSDVVSKTHCNLIGHFDLVTKFNERIPMIDVENPRYVAAYKKALDKLVPMGIPFEMNSNAVAKGYRTEPYPSKEILREISSRGGKVILSSDCHDGRKLDFYFDEMVKIAKDNGFDKVSVLTADGEKEIEI